MKKTIGILTLAALIAVAAAACGGETPATTTTADQGGGSQTASSSGAAPQSGPIEIVSPPKVVFLPEQIGGHFHTAFAIIKNTSSSDLDVQAQFSMTDTKGLDGTSDASSTVLAGQEAVLLSDAVKLPRPFTKGKVGLATSTSDALITSDALKSPSAILISQAKVVPGTFGESCHLKAVVTNKTSGKQTVKVTLVGFKGETPVSVGFDYPDLFPGTPKQVDIQTYSKALCPKGITEVRGYWEPSF